MKTNAVLNFVWALGSSLFLSASAHALTTQYYYGVATIRVLLPVQVPASTEEMLMKRIVDPERGYLVELACLKRPGQKAYSSPFYMRVSENGIRVGDTKDLEKSRGFRGTAQVSGPAWDWNFLRFSMDWIPSPSHIDDVNTVTDSQIIARKQILTPGGMLFETYNVDADRISADEFSSRFSAMGCPASDVYP